ncbi:hypothetical protein PybrP1_010852 [[Pythium] brassicae (nom. inval.)]|nr:hypothetical protein PybrP1_010852 [[Pythium] brassicae (nom. inval.)]
MTQNATSAAPHDDEMDAASLQQRMRIRQYMPADHAAVVTLFVDGMRSYAGHQGEGNHQYIQRCLEGDLADIPGTYIAPGGNFWVATLASEEGEDEIIGTIAYERKAARDGEVRRLSVKSSFRRFGIGRVLVSHLEQWAKAHGFASVSLNTGTVMHDAVHFYKKIGYAVTKVENESGDMSSAAAASDAMRVRQFVSADAAAVAELFAEGMNSYPAHQNAYNAAYVASCLREDLAEIEAVYLERGGNFLVATMSASRTLTEARGMQEHEEVVVGMVGLERLPSSGSEVIGELRRLSVRADCKRHGVGRLLVDHLERWARESGFARINLSTGVVMREANAFYTKLGYRFVGEEPEAPEYMLAIAGTPVIEIRQFRLQDYDDICTLFRNGMMFYTDPSHEHHCVWLDYIKNSLATDLADIEGFYVQRAGCNFFTATATNAATGEQEIVGSIGIERKSDDLAELRRVSVKAEYRRYGIGKLLINHATEWVREHGYSRLTLSTAATQHLAIKFYEALGYAFTRTSFRAEDHAAVVELFSAGMLLYATTEDIAFWESYVKKSIVGDIADIHGVYIQPGGNFWIAAVEGEVVGMVGFEAKTEREGDLRRLAVKASARGFGIGRQLVAQVEKWANENGFATVKLGTGEGMHHARKLYALLGYEHTHTVVFNREPLLREMWFAKTVVREFREEDLPDAVALFSAGMMHYAVEGHPQYCVWVDYVRNTLATDLADVRGHYMARGGGFWVATMKTASAADDGGEEIVGILGVNQQSDGVGELARMSVKKQFRRFGIGQTLLEHVERWAAAHGFTTLTLSNGDMMTQAHNFYLKLGYAYTRTTVLCPEPLFEVKHFEKRIAIETRASAGVVIRQYCTKDHAAIVELFSSGMLLYATENFDFWQGYVDSSVKDDLANVHGVYIQPGGNFWVATIEDEIVGMVGLEAKPEREGELRRMSVKNSARRYGVGRLLVAELERWAKESGYAKVWLSTGAVMAQACKFYLSLGYEQTHTEVFSHDPYFEAVKLEAVVIPDIPRTPDAAPPEVRIRQYQLSDQQQVEALFESGMIYYADLYADTIPGIHNMWRSYVQESIDDDLSKIEQVYLTPGGNFWVATVTGAANGDGKEKVVGMVALEKKADGQGELRRMSVSSEYRRFGLGRRLVAHLEAWAKENGYTKVRLSTGAIMKNAVKFYPSIGYELIRTEIVNVDPDQKADVLKKKQHGGVDVARERRRGARVHRPRAGRAPCDDLQQVALPLLHAREGRDAAGRRPVPRRGARPEARRSLGRRHSERAGAADGTPHGAQRVPEQGDDRRRLGRRGALPVGEAHGDAARGRGHQALRVRWSCTHRLSARSTAGAQRKVFVQTVDGQLFNLMAVSPQQLLVSLR